MADNEFSRIVGREIAGAEVDQSTVETDTTAILTDTEGNRYRFALSGDCCSGSYYDDPKQFQELVGSTILDVEERAGDGFREDDSEVAPHFLVFRTDRGHVTIDWRNISNGWYDGECHMTCE
jgi:hypothetical protein